MRRYENLGHFIHQPELLWLLTPSNAVRNFWMDNARVAHARLFLGLNRHRRIVPIRGIC